MQTSYCPQCKKDQPVATAGLPDFPGDGPEREHTLYDVCAICRQPVDPPRESGESRMDQVIAGDDATILPGAYVTAVEWGRKGSIQGVVLRIDGGRMIVLGVSLTPYICRHAEAVRVPDKNLWGDYLMFTLGLRSLLVRLEEAKNPAGMRGLQGESDVV